MFKLKKSAPYNQGEIMAQQRIVAEAIRQRESLRDINKLEDHSRASTSVEVAQEILNFMLEENVHKWKKK